LTYAGLTVVVPTRNRWELAATAVRSVVGQGVPNVFVLVSDNSTTASDAQALEALCREEFDRYDVLYVRPPGSLAMSSHWQWALHQALERTLANHVLYLTDRMLLKPGAVAKVAQLVEAGPEDVLSYHHDTVFDHERPVRLLQEPWSGRLFEVASRHLLYLSSRAVIHAALPRMLNCVVPRDVLSSVEARFGTVFDSISPDFCFAYRCLATVQRIHYLDEALMVQHGLGSSHGFTYTRGVESPVRSDFSEQLGRTTMNFASPVPEFQTIRNAILHEYAYVRSELGPDELPAIDPRGYLAAVVEDLSQVEDRRVRREMLAVLADNGWVGAPKRRYDRAMLAIRLMFAGWDLLRAASRVIRRVPGLGRRFDTPEAAIEHAQRSPRAREASIDHVSALFTPPGSTTEIPSAPA
jgi:hypothetical protein